jgi:hypothetical protein
VTLELPIIIDVIMLIDISAVVIRVSANITAPEGYLVKSVSMVGRAFLGPDFAGVFSRNGESPGTAAESNLENPQ